MVREYEQITFTGDITVEDMMDQIMAITKSMKHQMFDARPLPKDPIMLTYESNPSLINNTELWKDTCPVCRPIVRDMKVFCTPSQEATFQEQNVFIRWDIVFSKLASVLVTPAPLGPDSTLEDNDLGKTKTEVTGQAPPETKTENTEQSDPIQSENDYQGLEEQTVHYDKEEVMIFCPFCAYFACLMFDDPTYSFATSTEGIGDFELDCCCMDSMMESKRVEKVRRKLLDHAERFGHDAHITFLVQPIDYDLEYQAFGKIRFQAYAHAQGISKQDLFDITGFRRELVLEVYRIPGE